MDKKMGLYILLGLLIGVIFGLLLGAVQPYGVANLWLDALVGVSAGLSVSSSSQK